MMEPRKRKLIVAGLLLFYILCGFFREFIFININEQCRVMYYQHNDSHVSPLMQWLCRFSYSQLYYTKWILTLLFSAYFAWLAVITVKVQYNDKGKQRITWIVYGVTFLLSLLFYLGGALSGKAWLTYDISRFLAGLIETPAMLIILLAAFMMKKSA